jgi:hypothetical protein
VEVQKNKKRKFYSKAGGSTIGFFVLATNLSNPFPARFSIPLRLQKIPHRLHRKAQILTSVNLSAICEQ